MFLLVLYCIPESNGCLKNIICCTIDPAILVLAPSKVVSVGTVISVSIVVLITFCGPPILILPAIIWLVSRSDPPTLSLFAKKVAIALCVGITLLLSSEKKGSVENSLITAPEPPNLTPPNAYLLKPSRSKN